MKRISQLITGVLLLVLMSPGVRSQDELRIAADASLAYTMTDLAAAFERDGGAPVRVSLGSSAELGRQIAAGAPYTLFLSADQGVVEGLIEDGVLEGMGEVYARSSLALQMGRGAPVRAGAGLDGLAEALRGRRLGGVVMVDPAVSAHGRATRESLRGAGLWADVQDHLSFTRNAAQAARRVDGGPAQVAILPRPLTVRRAIESGGATAVIPAELHEPVEHVSVVLTGGDDSPAAAFQAFLQGEEGQAVLEEYGFVVPPF